MILPGPARHNRVLATAVNEATKYVPDVKATTTAKSIYETI